MSIYKSSILSLTLHVFIFIVALLWNVKPPLTPPPPLEITLIDTTKQPIAPKARMIPTHSSKSANTKTPPTAGVSKSSTAENTQAADTVKLGNTLSKASDNNPSSEAALPATADEFEISVWPSLKNDIQIPYPKDAKAKNIEGIVIMDLYVSEQGQVLKSTLVTGPGYGLNEAALEAAKKFVFSPAKVGSQNVPIVIRYSYKFVIQR